VADPEKGRIVQGRTGKMFKNVKGRERPSEGESHGKRPGMEEQVRTSGEASVRGLAWPSGEPRFAVMLVRLPASFMEQMRGFHDLLKQKPSSLFILLGWSSISIASLMMYFFRQGKESIYVLT
jgi:hypothetical protein